MARIASISVIYADQPGPPGASARACGVAADAAIIGVLRELNAGLAGAARTVAKLRVRKTVKTGTSATYWMAASGSHEYDFTMVRAEISGVRCQITVELGPCPFTTIMNSGVRDHGCELVKIAITHAGSRVVNCDRLARDISELCDVRVRRVDRGPAVNTYYYAGGDVHDNYITVAYAPGLDVASVVFDLGPHPLETMLAGGMLAG